MVVAWAMAVSASVTRPMAALTLDRGDVGIGGGDVAQDGGFGTGIGINRGDVGMRRTCDGAGVQRHHKAHSGVGEIDHTQAGDGGDDVAAKDVHGQLIAEFQAKFFGFFGGERDLRRCLGSRRATMCLRSALALAGWAAA